MPQIFDVAANENARYKRNELECSVTSLHLSLFSAMERDVHVIVFTVYFLLVVNRKNCLMIVANLSFFSLYRNLVFKTVK